MIPCVTGLFIGVDEYGEVVGSLRARADAQKLHGLFANLRPGDWRLGVDDVRTALGRVQVLRAVQDWLRAIPLESAGLLYIAGHSVVTEQGLVFAARDFDNTLAAESGVPLRLMLEYAARLSPSNSVIVIVLDTCRMGDGLTTIETIPSNVTLVYSCRAGVAAMERGETGGIFAECLLSAAGQVETFLLNGIRCSTLANLLAAIRRQGGRLSDAEWSGVEVVGVSADGIALPAPKSSVREERTAIVSRLTSRSVDDESARRYRLTLTRLLRAWVGYDVGAIEYKPTGNGVQSVIVLTLPMAVLPRAPSACLNYFVSQCASVFETLRIEWEPGVEENWIAGNLRQLGAQRLEAGALEYIWRDGLVTGVVGALVKSGAIAAVEVSCWSKEGRPLALDHLGESLGRIYDRLVDPGEVNE